MIPFGARDREALAARGISEEEATRQIATLRRPPRWTRLDRPCTLGDGVRRLERNEFPALLEAQAEASMAGRFTKFVPASGAATRMFRELLHYQCGEGRDETFEEIRGRADNGDPRAETLVRFVDELKRFAFYAELERTLASRGQDAENLASKYEFLPLLDGLLDSAGMDYDRLPKGLLLFHCEGEHARTPFEEHLVEAARYARSENRDCRLHFTVSPEHRDGFERLLAQTRSYWTERLEATFDVGWSFQKPSTDTLAIDAADNPFRDEAGNLVFRPGGHGALIENLSDLAADLVYIKNIDNVQPEHRRGATVLWKKLLGGVLVQTERTVRELLESLGGTDPQPDALRSAEAFARVAFGIVLPEVTRAGEQCRRAFLAQQLHRPLRVCGVVPNTGEPGGGPFWVRASDGTVSAQVVESAQVDPEDQAQREILGRSTHFNPVDLVCAVRDVTGQPFDLTSYIDPDTAIIASKSVRGRDLKALERPGLWNGAMAGWNTLFVEVPLETFTPVKSVLDLLREEHAGLSG